MFTTKKYSLLVVCVFSLCISCKKFVEVPPPSQQVISDVVFTNDQTATSAVVGIYSEMMKTFTQFCASTTTLYAGMYGDELQFYSPGPLDAIINSNLTEAEHGALSTNFWTPAYRYIYIANLCIEKLEVAQSITPSVKNVLIGEAKFVRAFCFFNLVNLFGDVPLTIRSDYRVNAVMPRTAVASVFNQIVADLTDAKNRLAASYTGTDRSRPNKYAAASLLSRAYLYMGEWAKAETEAAEVISSGMYSLPTDLNNAFLKSSSEAVWQLQPVNTSWNTWEGREIIPPSSSAPPTYILRPELLNAFEMNDKRKNAWVATRTYLSQNFSYPFKYKEYGNNAPITEYYMVLRLAEQYLIRSEARARQNNVPGSKSDLDIIRTRAGLPVTTANDQPALYNAIEKERRIELFAEWGHRWFDLKRTNRASIIIGALKPSTWQALHVLWPIPIDQVQANPALIQNPGY